MTTLGTLSIHLDGSPCKVGCAWCYLGAREAGTEKRREKFRLPVLAEALGRLQYQEVAVALSEPLAEAGAELRQIVAAARGLVTVTTTPQLARRARGTGLLAGVGRLNLSIDSWKGVVEPAAVERLAGELKAAWPALEVVLIATLDSPEFAARLIDGGLLEALVGVAAVDKVALNALKPPPAWCDRKWWMGALGRLEGLLERELEKRLFLDCYVAARLVGLGGCPGRADLSPAAGGGVAFRGCVYQKSAEAVVAGAAELAAVVETWSPPAACPFEIR